MVFSSILFVFGFLPLLLLIYFISKDKYRNYILIFASLIFYAYGEPKFVFVMLLSIILNYCFALAIDYFDKKKNIKVMLLLFDIILNISILFVYKYLDFSINIANNVFNLNIPLKNIVLPIGISFFTFQALSYVIDVYRKNAKVQKNPFKVALYIALFPQLIAGPIVRYSTIAKQIDNRKVTLETFGLGVKRFLLGFSKKVILANNLALVAEEVFSKADFSLNSPVYFWIGSIAFSLQIFFDFSGYSDMAIGLGKMFGFEFEENFNYPYIANSFKNFWQRWHISLSVWFRDYVYIPLGGSRKKLLRNIFNLFVVWILTGIWHGAAYTFIAWGLMYFFFISIEKHFIKPESKSKFFKVIWRIIVLLVVNFGWVLFNSKGLHSAYNYILAMLGNYNNTLIDSASIRILREFGIYLILGVLFSTPIIKKLDKKMFKNKKVNILKKYLFVIIIFIIFFWAISFLALGSHNPFIYFNF